MLAVKKHKPEVNKDYLIFFSKKNKHKPWVFVDNDHENNVSDLGQGGQVDGPPGGEES